MNAHTKEFDNLTQLAGSMQSMVEASRLMNRLAMLKNVELIFDDNHGGDRRVYWYVPEDDRDTPDAEGEWRASIKPVRKPEVMKRGFGTFEEAFAWVLEGM